MPDVPRAPRRAPSPAARRRAPMGRAPTRRAAPGGTPRRWWGVALLLVLLASPVGQGAGVVQAPHVRVWFARPELEPYAQRVADAAEQQLLAVAAWFGRDPVPVTVRIADDSDVFNAFALPLPRPTVTLRALFPLDGEIGFRAADPLAMLLRHELTHLVQLTDTRVPPGTARLPRVGLVGEGTAVLPPAWLLEGIATWMESTPGPGGRLEDPDTRALIDALAAGGSVPPLPAVSLSTFDAWPGGEARYLLGASFLDALIGEHGFGALVDALHVFQAGGRLRTFSQAWSDATGTDLAAEWEAWESTRATDARRRARAAAEAQAALGAATDWGPSRGRRWGAAASPDGRRVAWAELDGVHVATVGRDGPQDERVLEAPPGIEALAWRGSGTLVASALASDPGRQTMELFERELAGGAWRRRTWGAHAHLPRATPDGCVLYVRDTVVGGSSLRRWCPQGAGRAAGDAAVWRAPEGEHLVGLAVSPAGRVAVSAFRGGSVHLRVRQGAQWREVPTVGEVALDPTWEGNARLLYTGVWFGVRQVFGVDVGPGSGADGSVQRSALFGGAVQPVVTADGVLVRSYASDGEQFVLLAAGGGAPVAGPLPARTRRVPGDADPSVPAGGGEDGPGAAPRRYPVVPDRPLASLLPYGWLPVDGRLSLAPLGAGVTLRVPAEDLGGRYGWAITAGYDTALHGALAGGFASLSAGWRMPGLVPDLGPAPPLGVELEAGVWPHVVHGAPVTTTAFGVRAEVLARAPVAGARAALALRGGVVRLPDVPGWHLQAALDARLDDRRGDAFGAVTGGSAFTLRARWDPAAGGPVAGVWGEAETWSSGRGASGTGASGTDATGRGVGEARAPGIWHAELRAGYRPTPQVPLVLPDAALVATLGARFEVPVGLRVGDGLYALERLDIEPEVTLWGGVPGPVAGAGAALALWADTVLDYQAPVRWGVRAGFAQGWWLELGVRWPF